MYYKQIKDMPFLDINGFASSVLCDWIDISTDRKLNKLSIPMRT